MTRWITAALNGSVVSRRDTPLVPITPEEIARDAVACARAGAAVVHIHVRDARSGLASHDPALYAEVTARIRETDEELLIHFTGGGGGTLPVALSDPAVTADAAAAIQTAEARLAHLAPAKADLTGLDCGSFSYGLGGDVYLSPTDMLYRQAHFLARVGVRPELTVFDLGQMVLAARMHAEGAVPRVTPFCIGFNVIWGAPARPKALDAMLDLMPEGVAWTAGAKGELGHRAIAPLIVERGGGIRTGIEDHPTLDGEPATNARMVGAAMEALSKGGTAPLDAKSVRHFLGLGKWT